MFREFGAGVNNFYRNNLQTGEPYRIRRATDLHNYIREFDGVANCAVSVYTFAKENVDPIKRHNSAIFDVIAFDFDGDLEETLKDLRNLKKNLFDKLGMEALYTFTGGRGFHVYIYFDTFSPKTHIKSFLRFVQEYITKKCELKTVDIQTFGDVARLLRVPGTRHLKTGLYCTPLSQDEIFNLTLDEIRQMAKRPRAIPRTKDQLKKINANFFRWLELADKNATEENHRWKRRESRQMNEAAEALKKDGFACDGVVEALKGVSEGRRDNTLVGLIYFMKLKDIPKEEAEDILKSWADDCEGVLTDDYLHYKVWYHYNRGRSLPCGYLKKAGFCSGCNNLSKVKKIGTDLPCTKK